MISNGLSISLREQEITAEDVTVKLGETGKFVSGTVSEKAIEDVAALTGKFGNLSYAVTDGDDIIELDAFGAITTKAAGTATVTITAAANDYYQAETKTVTVTVSEKDPQTVTVSAPATIYVGDNTQKITAETDGDGALSYAVKASDPADAVTVAADGTITAAKAGTATITVTAAETDDYAEGTKEVDVTVAKRTQEVKAGDLTISDKDSGTKIEATVSEAVKSGVAALSDKTAKPVFTSSDENIATVDADGVITVKGTGKVTISMTLPKNEYYDAVTVPTDITLTVDPLSVIEGEGGKYTIGSKEGLTFRSNGVFGNFVGVQVDGGDVDASNYTAWEGSTYIKFIAKYLDSLAAGKHKLTYVFANGTCDADFYIIRPSGGSPKTGDSSSAVLWANLILINAFVVYEIIVCKKRKAYEAK